MLLSVPPSTLIRRLLQEVNTTRSHRDVHLVCRDGALSWSSLFFSRRLLSPALSAAFQEEAAAAAARDGGCGRCRGGKLTVLLADFGVDAARRLLSLLTGGKVDLRGEGEVEDFVHLLRAFGVDAGQLEGAERVGLVKEQGQEVREPRVGEAGVRTQSPAKEEKSDEEEDGESDLEGHEWSEEEDFIDMLSSEDDDDDEEGQDDDEDVPKPREEDDGSARDEVDRAASLLRERCAVTSADAGGLDSLRCPVCSAFRSGMHSLLYHLTKCHFYGEVGAAFPSGDSASAKLATAGCPICGKSFRSRKSLVLHLGSVHKLVLRFVASAKGGRPLLSAEALHALTTAAARKTSKEGTFSPKVKKVKGSFRCPECHRTEDHLSTLMVHLVSAQPILVTLGARSRWRQ